VPVLKNLPEPMASLRPWQQAVPPADDKSNRFLYA